MYSMRHWAGVGAALAFVFVLGITLGGKTQLQATGLYSTPDGVPTTVDLAPVWKAWSILNEKFVPSTTSAAVTDQDKVWGMISGLAGSYGDPYTVFMPPQEAKSFQEDISGSFSGVGVEIGFRNDMLTVIAPLKGTPADAAGIRSGDVIAELDGKSTRAMTMDEVISAIRGDVGTQVVFTIAREGEHELLRIPVTRAVIEVPTIKTELVGDDVYAISLYNFGGTATREMNRALRGFVAGGYSKLLIDLRGNPGGYLEAAVDIASWFLPAGKIIVTEEYGDGRESIVHRSKGRDIMKSDWRIAVLVDGGSASASEILAGALSEHGTAKLIGEQTFGKGSVQELVTITPDTALKVTVARWLTPNGISISAAGLTPDLVVPLSAEDSDAGRDPQKDAALEYLRTGTLTPPASEDAAVSSSSPALEASQKVE